MTQPSQTLRQILVRIRDNRSQNLDSLVVFDLDSTLFDVGPRLERILIDFAQEPENQKRFPEQVKHFKNIKIERRDWGFKNSLVRAGLDGHHPEFKKEVHDYWYKTFFSNEYLHFDIPYRGAVEYVQKLAQAGAEIVYLTGRDIHRMEKGSLEVLQKWHFPLDGVNSRLVLKPHKEMDDAQFKSDWFLNVPENKHKNIWFFENEPVNIKLIREHAPQIEIIFFDSTHSGRAQPPEDLPSIMHFLLDE